MIKVILIDDEPMAITVMKNMLLEHQNIETVKTYNDPILAIKELKDTNPDIIFLDIEMKPHKGMDLAHEFLDIKPELEILFVTAYSKYAIEAFEVNAIDYLLKPVNPKRLAQAIEKIKNIHSLENPKLNNLKIQAVGNFNVNDQNIPIKWRTAKAKELLALLWI